MAFGVDAVASLHGRLLRITLRLGKIGVEHFGPYGNCKASVLNGEIRSTVSSALALAIK